MTVSHGWKRYPALWTVRMWRGREGSCSNFLRSSEIWVSTVRLTTAARCPHTSWRSSNRLTTAPRRRMSVRRRSSSFGVRETSMPSRSTVRDRTSILTAPNSSGSSPSAASDADGPRTRRRMASTRARSSMTPKGLVT